MRIIGLEAENIKRLRAVSITFTDGVMVIGGRNAQGKSSCLDAIAMALGGKDLVPGKPLRKGEAEGHVTVTLGEPDPLYTVTRRFTAKGTTSLVVKAADGSRPASPQSLLDGLLGRLSFDPLAFSRMEPKGQAETLRQLVGIDTTKIDQQIAAAYDKRTDVGRTVARLSGALGTMPHYPDAPKEEQSVSDLASQMREATEAKRERDMLIHRAEDARSSISVYMSHIESLKAAISEAEKKIRVAEQGIEDQTKAAEAADSKAKSITVPDVDAIQDLIADAEAVNKQIRENAQREKVKKELRDHEAAHAELDGAIDRLRNERRKMIEDANLPVEGLALDETGVTFGGVPFDQASASEQLRVSVAMGLAMNPRLKLILIRDGSLLDDDNLGMIAQMAEEGGAQVLVERVGQDAHTSIVIEDGEVAS